MHATRACLAVLFAGLLIDFGGEKNASAEQPKSPVVASPAPPMDPCKDPSPIIILTASDTRGKGRPTSTSHPFFAATPLDVCITVTSGGKPHHGDHATASAVVSGAAAVARLALDSSVLLSEHDFSPKFAGVKLERSLAAGPHALQIRIASAPGTFVKVVISTPAVQGRPVVLVPDHHDTSPPLRRMKQLPPPSPPVEVDRRPPPIPRTTNPPDPVLQKKGTGATIGDFAFINGIPVAGGYPPDPNASAGGTQVVETVNLAYAVFDKTSGRGILGPSGIATIWTGFGGVCETGGHSDPIVLFDKAAGRWLVSIMGYGTTNEECFAVSTSSDATGSYNRYSYQFATLPDMPKFGIWPDAYYASYSNAAAWACAYDRSAMLSGAPMPAAVCFPRPSGESSSVPSDLDGPTAPPPGEPNFYLGMASSFAALDMFKFHVDFVTPSGSSFTGPTPITIAPFGASVYQIPQRGTSQLLTNDGWGVLPRVAYRNFGSHESLVTCHSADSGGGSTGVRWYEIRNPAATPTVYQQGTYAPDSDDRFYCSAAMDGAGNIAVGYSVSSAAIFPAIRFAGRFASDPLGTLRAESSIIEGGGYQTGVVRWGDYSSMAIDPDDTTFVYTNEYMPQVGGPALTTGWSTRITTFTLNPFSATGSLGTPRFLPAVALLPTGKVLVAGGNNVGTSFTAVATAELYNSTTGTFAPTGSMTVARTEAQAILLPNGKVLVTGGYSAAGAVLASAELYDPATGTFTPTGSMSAPRVAFAAAVLPNGKVLIAGGTKNGVPTGTLATAEVYDLTTGTFTPTGAMIAARAPYSAAVLPNGKVLIAGGYGTTIGSVLASAELYDPSSGTFTATGSLSKARVAYAESLLPNGKVLIAGGTSTGDNTGTLASAEVYDPSSGTFAPTGSLNTGRFYMSTAALLPNGHVLLAGGRDSTAAFLTSAEVYNPATGTFLLVGTGMSATHFRSPLLLLPNAKAFIAGGDSASSAAIASAELYDSGYPRTVEAFTANGAMTSPRQAFTATQLPNGTVLIAGGTNGPSLSLAELYNPSNGAFTSTGNMTTARSAHTATLLPDGRVLVAGGQSGGTSLSSAELYDPSTGMSTPTGSMTTTRSGHTATLLPTGKVLIAGGIGPTKDLATAELYDPATGAFTATGTMASARTDATAVLLTANGKVLIAGGVHNKTTYLVSAELYDPWAGSFAPTGSMATARATFSGVLLANGAVLVAGGVSSGTTYLSSAELYDPYAGGFTAAGNMSATRSGQTATLLPSGNVVVAGGFNGSALAGAELYVPESGAFVATGGLLAARCFHTATLLGATGKLLMTGGFNGISNLNTTELYQ